MKQAKVTQQQIDEATKLYLDKVPMEEIEKRVGLASTTIYKHMKVRRGYIQPEKELRPNKFDLEILDTIIGNNNFYRVIEITDYMIVAKEVKTDMWNQSQIIKVPIKDYLSGESGYRRQNIAPCKVLTVDKLSHTLTKGVNE